MSSEIKRLLDIRELHFNKISDALISELEKKLRSSLELYFKTDREIKIHNIIYYELNRNFVQIFISIELKVGDSIQLADGELVNINEDNINNIIKPIKILLPLNCLDNSSVEILRILNLIDDFIISFSLDDFWNIIDSGIKDLSYITKNTEVFDTLNKDIPNINLNNPEPENIKLEKRIQVCDFSVDELTIEQKKALDLYTLIHKKLN